MENNMNALEHELLYCRLDSYPRIICIKDPGLSAAVVSLWFQAGSRYAPPGKDGLPHLFEHLFLVNNEGYRDKRLYLSEMEKNGFLYNAYTDKSLVDYYFFCEPGHEVKALEQLIVAYRTTAIREQDVQREKDVVINEEKRNRAAPSQYIWRLANQGLWPNTELSRDIYGTEETLGAISMKDIATFKQSYYQPNNMTVLVITPTDIDVDNIVNMLSIFKMQRGLTHSNVAEIDVRKEVREQRSGDVAHVGISYRYKALTFYERICIHFISHYLTGGWSGRLIQRLRLEKGVTYWVTSNVHHSYDSGCLQFYFTAKKEHLQAAIENVRDEINRLCLQGIDQADIVRFQRSFMVKNCITKGNPYEALQYYGRSALVSEKRIHLYDDYIYTINHITKKQLLETAKNHLNEVESSLAIIG